MFLVPASGMAVVGMAWTDFSAEIDAALDELAFDVTRRALADAALRHGDVGHSLLASLDLYEGRSMSNGMTSPAAGGYLTDEFRLENDASAAILSAWAGIRANDADIIVVTTFHNPEVSVGAGTSPPRLYDQVSNQTFDPVFGRPVGLTGHSVLAMHAAAEIAAERIDERKLAELAAADITRGAGAQRAFRPSADADEVANSTQVAWPLTELMLPAYSCGAVSLVFATAARAARCRQIHGWVRGLSIASSPYLWSDAWLTSAAQPTRAAAARAYRQAGRRPEDVVVVEETSLTPALRGPILDGLGVCSRDAVVSPSGGVRSTFPGFANGALRIVETLTWLAEHPPSPQGCGLAHSTEYLAGTSAANTIVAVVEGA